MKKALLFSLLLTITFSFTPSVEAGPSPRLYAESPVNKGEYVEIVYDINFPGFVQLCLFNEEKEQIWIKGRVTDRVGKDYFRISTNPLKAGARYTFILKYKGKDYPGSFYM